MPNLQCYIAGLRGAGRKLRAQFAADHQGDDLLLRGLRRVQGGDDMAVTHDGHTVGERHDLIHTMRDVNDGDAFLFQSFDEIQKRTDLLVGQSRRGLVHHKHLAVVLQSLGNLHQLALRHRQVAGQLAGIDVHVHLGKQLLGAADHLLLVDDDPLFSDLTSDEDVLIHRNVVDHVEFLIDHADAGRPGLRGREVPVRRTVDVDGALGGGDSARQDFAERRLSRAVFSGQRMNLSPAEGEIGSGQRNGAAVYFFDSAGSDDVCLVHNALLLTEYGRAYHARHNMRSVSCSVIWFSCRRAAGGQLMPRYAASSGFSV